MSKTETYADYKHISDKDVIARILGIKNCPVDKLGTPLVNIRRQRVYKVLPAEYFGVIFTPRLEICDENGLVLKLGKDYRGIDDMTYRTYPEIQRVVPRCYSIFLIFERQTEKLVERHIMHGYYKFGGSSKDEDTNVNTLSILRQAPISETERVVITEKANGKAAVMTMFRFEGQLFMFGGSKGDHYVTPVSAGMEFMQRLNRNLFAFYIFDVFFKIWRGLPRKCQDALIAKLCGDKSGDQGYTLCAEYEDGRHMVPLPLNSEGLPVNDNLRMFGLVKNRGAIKRGTTLCEDVSETLNWFASIGLPHTPFHVKNYDEFKAIKETLREGMLKEGFVLHYQIKSGRGGYVTIGVEKHKIWWYIVLRLLREFMRHRRNVFSRRWSENLWTRLEDRNKSYMDMSAGMLRKWYKLLCKFVRWFFDRKYEKHMNLIGFESGSLGMGTMWREFLFDYPEIDDSFGFHKNTIEFASWRYKTGRLIAPGKLSRLRNCLLVFQGIPGLGKTTLSLNLKKRFGKEGLKTIALEQDALTEQYGLKKSGAMCIKKLKELINSRKFKAVFLMRNNSCYEQFVKYAEVAKSFGWDVHVFYPEFLSSSLHLLFVCLQSVYQRSFKGDHPTFKSVPIKRQIEITLSFFACFRRAKESATVDSVSSIQWISPNAVENKMSVKPRRREAEYLRCLVKMYLNSDSPFSVSISEHSFDVLSLLGIKTENYQKWRKTASEISEECTEKINKISEKHFKKRKSPKINNSIVTEDMMYITLNFDSVSQDILSRLLSCFDFDFTDLDIPKMDHLTMIFGNKDDRTGNKIWRELVPMNEKTFGVVVNGVAFWPRNLICFTASVRTKVSFTEGTSLLHLVHSKHPHITAMTAKNVAQVESIKLLKYLAKEESGEGRIFIPLKEKVLIQGNLRIARKSGFKRV